ncbi:MAG TPA: hypothetical protein PLX89_20885 [Verrucomicrobiota bacterium]|nr:hypothetical protein [Verrucomicrobiota bacterium]
MTNQRLGVNVEGNIRDNLTYNISFGADFRQFLDTGEPTKVSPVWSGGLRYQVSPTTSVSFDGTRNVSTSYYTDQYSQTLALSATITREFLGRYTAFVRAGYRWSDYNSTLDPTLTVQTANYSTIRVGVRSPFLVRGSAVLSYSWSNNDASNEGLGFTSNQVSLYLSYGF